MTTITQSQAIRFLTQATMGASPKLTARVQGVGYIAWLNEQMAMPVRDGHYAWMSSHNDPETGKPFNHPDFKFQYTGFDASVWRKLLSAPDALRQRVVFALSEIIVVSLDGLDGYWPQFRAAAYVDLLEKHAFGNYRQLLQAISTNAAMGQYLTFVGNQKHNPETGSYPDENYAREILQLFTIGLYQLNIDGTPKLINGAKVETYQQNDISQLARIFTGWEWSPLYADRENDTSFAKNPMAQIPEWHETGASTFLGKTVPADLTGAASLTRALDIIFAHPNVAPFVCRQLIQKLVTSNPAPAYVARVARVFNNNGAGVKGDMKAVIKAILLDDAARNSANLTNPTFGKVREPILRFTAWARAFEVSSSNSAWEPPWSMGTSWGLGQGPMRAPSVFNFYRPGYVPPNSSIANARLVAPELQLSNETSVVGYLNYMTYVVYSFSKDAPMNEKFANLTVNYDGLKNLEPIAIVKKLSTLLTANQLHASTVSIISDAIAQISHNMNNRIYAAVLLVLATPEFTVSK